MLIIGKVLGLNEQTGYKEIQIVSTEDVQELAPLAGRVWMNSENVKFGETHVFRLELQDQFCYIVPLTIISKALPKGKK